MLGALAGPAGAAWVEVGAAEAGMRHYFDPATLSASGDLRRVQRLASQDAGPQREAMSNQSLWQVDCRLAQGRIVQMWWFQDAMAQGLSLEITFRTDTGWQPIAPGSPSQALMGRVCGP